MKNPHINFGKVLAKKNPLASTTVRSTITPSLYPMDALSRTTGSGNASESTRWFTEEVHRHDRDLRNHIRRAFPSIGDVDDVMQESYLRIWKRRGVEPIRCAKAFLYMVSQRIAIDILRRRRRSPTEGVEDLALLEVADDSPAVHDRLSLDEKVELLVEAIDSLPSRCREVVILRKLKSLSQHETARLLGITEKGVEAQLARGMERCRRFFRRRGVRGFFSHEI